MIHGGDVYRNNIDIDFSVNVNPLGISESIERSLDKFIKHINKYPDYKSEILIKKLSDIWNIKESGIICGNGASELIMAVIHALKPKKALLPVPSFYGYRHALISGDTETIYYYLKKEKNFLPDDGIIDLIKKEDNTDLIIIANPNNPTGKYIDSALQKELLDECRKRNITVLLDECFMELSDERNRTMINNILEWDNLLVLRAFTKTFAMPALRLGYLIGSDPDKLSLIRKHLPEWNVSLVAQMAGEAALDDTSYPEKVRKMISEERKFLTEEFNAIGIKAYPSDTNFILIKTKIPLFEKLLDEKILIRSCKDFLGLDKDYYRIAIKQHDDNIKLIESIKRIAEIK